MHVLPKKASIPEADIGFKPLSEDNKKYNAKCYEEC